ncbi:aromatic acid exporter family protein [Aerococcus sanguinicola]|uniref:Aromatic acid exporter family protein n=2 Tax=Aerococcaceae TaxID=186827 RepID=A0A5N1GK30_9LACT|nr:aromatic acid exporter family protein [Aerococcus sanguinicola]
MEGAYGMGQTRFHLGMRTFKTGLSFFLIAMLYDLFSNHSPQIAALSAGFSQRTDFQSTNKFGRHRIFGNFIGGLMALLCVSLMTLFPDWRMLSYLFPALGIVLTIILGNAFNSSQAIVGSIAIYTIVLYSIPDQERILYVFWRLVDTLVGAAVALFVEWALSRERVDAVKNLLTK